MARLPSISRAVQTMLQENILAIQHKMAGRPKEQRAEPFPQETLDQLEVMARINSINLKADPQTKDSEDEAAARVPPAKAARAFATIDSTAPARGVIEDEGDE